MAVTAKIIREKESGLRQLYNKLARPKSQYVAAGFFDPHQAYIATIQEYGTIIKVTPKMRGWFGAQGFNLKKTTTEITIPPRPFMSMTYENNYRVWGANFKQLLVKNNYDVEMTLKQMGALIQGQIQKTIVKGDFQPNSALTVKLKGFDLPLRHTGEMLNAVTWELQ